MVVGCHDWSNLCLILLDQHFSISLRRDETTTATTKENHDKEVVNEVSFLHRNDYWIVVH